MGYTELNKENFNDIIEKKDMVIVDFWAPWCGPCRTFGPIFEKVSEEYPDVTFVKCNTEDEGELAGALQIKAIPTLMVFRDQALLFRQSGSLPEGALRELLDKISALDMDEVRKEIAEEEAKAETGQEDAPS